MLARAARARKGEDGFTLIELLVVIIIVGILAAIALPTMLKQREKGWNAAAKASLKNAAIAQESYFTEANPSSYATTPAQLEAEGWNDTPNVTLTVTSASGLGFCMRAFHNAKPTSVWYFSSDVGAPTTSACA